MVNETQSVETAMHELGNAFCAGIIDFIAIVITTHPRIRNAATFETTDNTIKPIPHKNKILSKIKINFLVIC